jgi:hypothetical protein
VKTAISAGIAECDIVKICISRIYPKMKGSKKFGKINTLHKELIQAQIPKSYCKNKNNKV